MKRILIGISALVGLLILIAAVGAGWYVVQVRHHLTPPPDPAGQKSIADYARTPAVGNPAAPPALLAEFDWNTIATPPKSTRAWTRWWWPGGDVDTKTLIEQLTALDAAGFGGAEVQPFISGIMAVADNAALMEKVYSFDTPAYYEALNTTLDAAASLAMQLDLTHFSGWPPGGPEVNLEDSLTILAYSEVTIAGGSEVELALPRPKPGPSEYIFSNIEFAGVDFINFPADQARLLSVTAARTTAGQHAWNPFNLNDTVALEESSLQVITEYVQDGVLRWQAPAGDWTIIASYLMPSAEVPMGAAQKPQGFVIDHLRTPQVLGHYEYAYGDRTGLEQQYGKGFRGFFQDSLEFRLKRMSVDDILAEFRSRRGYDLEPYLPALYVEGVDNVYFKEILGVHAAPEFGITAMDERIRYDYQRTLSDLIIERFVESSADWAAQRGLVSRAQSYGMDIDILRALGANTIPETEQLWAGGADTALKFASSAAALYGRPLVSAESFVWINREYTPTARRIKAAADKLLLAGINHIIYHGTPYPWTGGASGAFGEEGWAPFSGPGNPAHFSSNVSPANTQLWPDVPALNAYIARSQNLLRQGRPAIDVLIYYPFLGFHGSNPKSASSEVLLNGSLPDTDPVRVASEDPALTAGKQQLDRVLQVPPAREDERVAWVEQLQPLLQELDSRGISWGWINDHALQSGLVASGALTASDGQYRAILLPDVDRIERSTLTSLGQLVARGTPVFIAGRQPTRQPGFRDAHAGDREVQQAVRELIAQGARPLEFSASHIASALGELATNPVVIAGQSAIKRYTRLLTDGGSIHFLANQSATADNVELQVPADQPLWWFDAVEGVAWPAQASGGKLSLSLNGFESRFLIVGVTLPESVPRELPAGMAMRHATRNWMLQDWKFNAGEFSAQWDSLPDWRTLDALRYARSGSYQHHFTLDNKQGNARYLLDLGLVQGSAAVSVNREAVGRASIPPFTVDITTAVVSGDNQIDIEILAPLRNVFVGRALAGDERYQNMKIYADSLVAAGLMGPVVLAEVDMVAPND
jgi:hypothetical protein